MLGRNALVMALAVLFTMAFAYTAYAYSASDTPFTYSGQVVATDNSNRSVTVQAGPNDQLIFSLNEGGTVMRCSMSGSFETLKIGDHVKVSFFERSNGNFIADTIRVMPSGMERC